MRSEVKLGIAALALIVLGVMLAVTGTTHEKYTKIEPGSYEVINNVVEVPAGKAYYAKFNTWNMENPRLYITLSVTGGNDDIDLIIEDTAGNIVHSTRVIGEAEYEIPLDSDTEYYLVLDNGFSVITDKTVKVYAVVNYDIPFTGTRTVKTTAAEIGEYMMLTGVILLLIAAAIGLVRTIKLSAKAFREGLRGQ